MASLDAGRSGTSFDLELPHDTGSHDQASYSSQFLTSWAKFRGNREQRYHALSPDADAAASHGDDDVGIGEEKEHQHHGRSLHITYSDFRGEVKR